MRQSAFRARSDHAQAAWARQISNPRHARGDTRQLAPSPRSRQKDQGEHRFGPAGSQSAPPEATRSQRSSNAQRPLKTPLVARPTPEPILLEKMQMQAQARRSSDGNRRNDKSRRSVRDPSSANAFRRNNILRKIAASSGQKYSNSLRRRLGAPQPLPGCNGAASFQYPSSTSASKRGNQHKRLACAGKQCRDRSRER